MQRQEIEQRIPHREPFLLVDEIVELTENRIRGVKRFTGEEYFFAGHYPGNPIVPGVLLCEAAMQCGAILLAGLVDSGNHSVPVATRMNNVRFKRMVKPGDTITLDVELDDRVGNAFFLTAKVSVDGKTAARLEFACTLAPSD
ncbi:3-hydroxyacyl-ACP dehydratase FabZ family protein [Thermostilla marina]